MRDSVPSARYSPVCNEYLSPHFHASSALCIVESVDSISRDEPDSPLCI